MNDGFHIYKYKAPDKQDFTYGKGKVDTNFHAIAENALFLSETLNVTYPDDRIELLNRSNIKYDNYEKKN